MQKLLKKFVQSLKNEKYALAANLHDDLTSLIKEKKQITAPDLECFAFQRKYLRKYEEAIFFFQASTFLYDDIEDTAKACRAMWRCGDALKIIVDNMTEDRIPCKTLVKGYLIPCMKDLHMRVQRKNTSPPNTVESGELGCIETHCVLWLEWCQGFVEDWLEREKTLRAAITRMERLFGDKGAQLILLYADLISHLGCTCAILQRFPEAIHYHSLSKAIYAKVQSVQPHEEERVKSKRIFLAELNLTLALRNRHRDFDQELEITSHPCKLFKKTCTVAQPLND